MIKLTSDKKNENQKLNSEVDEKRRKLEREDEEKAMQEGRSDPESVASSLTSDTTMSTVRQIQQEETSGESGGDDDTKKRKLPNNNGNQEGESSGDDSNNNINDTNNNSHSSRSNKKHRISSSEAMTEYSSGDDNRGGSAGTGSGSSNSRTGSGSGGSGSGSGGTSKTISSFSELTDSNRGSSSNNSGGGISDDLPTEQESRESTPGNRENVVDQPSISSISSDAAVASEKTSRDRNTGHKDVVFNNDKRMGRKRPPEEVTSLERTFELNYEEVFHKSNIPQLIATTSGKIVTWNQCFGKATGYRKSEIERMTIFSLVKPENLANFFEIVAAALRPDDEEMTHENQYSDMSGSNDDKKETEESIITTTVTNSSGEYKDLKQNTILESTSSQDSLSGRDTVICSNNDKDGGEQGDNTNTEVEKNGCVDVHAVAINKEEESSAKLEEGNESENTVYANSSNEESSSNSAEEEGANKTDTDNEEPSDNSTKEKGTKKINTLSKESRNEKNGKEKGKPEEDAKETNLTKNGRDAIMPKRLLNYTAMTLPCIDFPAMIKRNQAATESNFVRIPPLHVTVSIICISVFRLNINFYLSLTYAQNNDFVPHLTTTGHAYVG
jgi:PAS domain S-box-containing protein